MKKKINHTAGSIFALICFILKNRSFTIDEALLYFEKTGITIEKETILKYIRTLRKLGFVFEKTNNKTYMLKDIPLKINYDNNDEYAIYRITEALNILAPNDVTPILEKIIGVIPTDKKELLKNNLSIINNPLKNSHKKYEEYCKDKQRLKINTKNSTEQINFEPIEIISEKDAFYLKGWDIKQKQIILIKIEDINFVEQTPTKNKLNPSQKEAVVEFSSQISKIYTLKDGEVALRKTPSSLVVKTEYDNEEQFFKRILKYMGTCKIISPDFLATKFAIFAKELYQMYDCPK